MELPSSKEHSAESKSLKLLSYNIFMRLPGIKNKGEGDFKEGRLLKFQELVGKQNFDVLCLQEMHSDLTTRRQRLYNNLNKIGFKYTSNGPASRLCKCKFVDSGHSTSNFLFISFSPLVDFL